MKFIFSWEKDFTCSVRSLVKYFFPLEDKLHMFAPLRNILYLWLEQYFKEFWAQMFKGWLTLTLS